MDKITKAIPLDDYCIEIITSSGISGIFDVSPYLDDEAFSPLRDQKEFTKVANGGYFVEWDCGADLSADTIEAQWRLVGHRNSAADA